MFSGVMTAGIVENLPACKAEIQNILNMLFQFYSHNPALRCGKTTTMTKTRFKTLIRNGKFVSKPTTYIKGLGCSEFPELYDENIVIDDIKQMFIQRNKESVAWVIDRMMGHLDQCELVTIEVKIVKDIPERVRTEKTSC